MILYEYDIMENQSSEQGIYARINPAFVGSHADVTKKSFFYTDDYLYCHYNLSNSSVSLGINTFNNSQKA